MPEKTTAIAVMTISLAIAVIYSTPHTIPIESFAAVTAGSNQKRSVNVVYDCGGDFWPVLNINWRVWKASFGLVRLLRNAEFPHYPPLHALQTRPTYVNVTNIHI